MEVCPLAKTGKELILELVNAENDSTITEEQLVFGEPEATDAEQNTKLNLEAAPDAPWNSFVDVNYDRLDLSTLFHGERAEVSVPKAATPADIICHLNYTYGTKFDVNEFTVTPVEDGELPELYKVEALANNLAYSGTFDVFVDLERMPLSARILTTDLNGFKYPNAGEPSLNNVIYNDNETSLSQLVNIGAYARPQAGQRDQLWSGMKSANNGELFMYLGGDVAWYTTNTSRFNWPYDADGKTMILDQVKSVGDTPTSSFSLTSGFHRANGTGWTSAELFDVYDISVELFTRNGAAPGEAMDIGYTHKGVGRVHPVDPQTAQWHFEGGAVVNWSLINDASTGRRFRAGISATESVCQGLRAWTASNSGKTHSRRHGSGYITITAKRKDGKGKPLTLRLDFRTNPEK